jgi:hypothetical protein
MVNLSRPLWGVLILSWFNLVPLSTIAGAQTNNAPANIFTSSLDEIKAELLPNLVLRLPSQILGVNPDYLNDPNLKVRIFSSRNQLRSTVAIYRCDVGAYSCLIGTFSVTDPTSAHGKYLWEQHQGQGAPLTMASGIRAYLIEEQKLNLASGFDSVMWQQDGALYTITFPREQRQSLLYMAVDMSKGAPIYSDRN